MVTTTRATSALAVLRGGRYDGDGRVLGRRPDEQYLNALLRQGWDEQTDQRRLDARMEAMLDDEHDLGLPDLGIESEEVRGGWALEVVQRIKQFWPNVPSIRIPAMGAGEDPENFANDLEEALNALISVQSKAQRGPGGQFYDQVKEQVVAFGRGYGALLPEPKAYRGFPQPPLNDDGTVSRDPEQAREYLKQVEHFGKGRLPPLRLRSLPARRVIPFFDSDGLAEVFWITSQRAWEVMERAAGRGASPNRTLHWVEEKFEDRAGEYVTCIYYANRYYCAELVGGPKAFPPDKNSPTWLEDCDILGEPHPHWLDRVPVAYFPGMTTPLSLPYKKTVSVVYQLRHVITMLDRIASQKATAVRTWAWPTPVLKTSLLQAGIIEANDDGRPKPIEITPGLMVTLWGDEDLSFLTYTGAGPDQGEMIELLERQFDRIGLPSVEGKSDVSGYLYAQLRSSVRGKYGSIESGLAQGWEDLAWIELEYLKQMPSTIWVPTVAEVGWAGQGTYADRRTEQRGSYLRLKPEQLKGRTFLMDVTVEPDKSLDMVANAQTANMLLQMKIPRRIVYEDVLGFKNSSQIKLMQMVQDLEDTPEYRQVIFAEALRQGRLLMQEQAQQSAGGMSVEELMNYSPGMIQAFLAQNLVDPAVAQEALAIQQQNILPGQMGGTLAGGGVPAGVQLGPYNAQAGVPGLTPMQGGMSSPIMQMGQPMGGVGSPAGGAPQAAPPAPSAFRGRGRAAGQSRAPRRERGGGGGY